MTNLPSIKPFAEAAESNLAALQSLSNITLTAAERLCALNIDATRSLVAFAAKNAVPAAGSDFTAQIGAQTKVANHGIEQATDYLRKSSDVYVSTQAALSDLHSEAIAELGERIQSLLNTAGKSAPLNTTDVFEAIKSAMLNATTAYENFVTTTRDVTNNSLSIATSALKPLAAANAPKASKKAA